MKRFLLIAILLLGTFISFAQMDEVEEDLNDLLAEYVDPDGPAVVFLVSSEEGEQWIGTAGLASLENETDVTGDDKFRIGSITKTYVATAVMLLAEEDILNIDDPISEWVPEDIISNLENADQVSMRQLMNMTSGIFNYTDTDTFEDAIFDDPSHPWTAEETLEFAYGEPAYFAPGEGFHYSNSNYNLLQIIIEAATGEPLATVLDEYLFSPLGLQNTFVEDPRAIGEGIVQGYATADSDIPENITYVNEGVGLGDGGIISTVSDMEIFARALFEGEIVSDESMAEMVDFVQDDEGDYYGLGISGSESDYGMLLGHDGATAGFQSTMIYVEDEGIVIIGLTNDFDSELLTDISDEILALLLDE